MAFNFYNTRVIFAQLICLSENETKVVSWGSNDWQEISDKILQFKVAGLAFKGNVRVEYDSYSDMYHIHFGHYKKSNWVNIHTVERLFFDQLVNVIDNYVAHRQDKVSA